jgi:hypothetical protein
MIGHFPLTIRPFLSLARRKREGIIDSIEQKINRLAHLVGTAKTGQWLEKESRVLTAASSIVRLCGETLKTSMGSMYYHGVVGHPAV